MPNPVELHPDGGLPPGESNQVRRIFLVGFMGAGKTTVGRLMARILGWVFLDLDREIETESGQRIADIFSNHGEEHFRRLEREQLAATLELEDVIVATGGGAYAFQENIDVIRRAGGVVVWLEPPLDEILRRLARSLQIASHSSHSSQSNQGPEPRRNVRPKLQSEDQARALFEERRPFYEQADHHITIAASDSPKKTARRIVKLIFGTQHLP
jgi:shikimate kinase